MYRVLIVEDEDIIRKGIAYTFDWVSMGCTIVGEAANGQEGIDKISELKPDIVLADIMMPIIDGIEMIKKAKEIVDFKAIILTSYADFEYAKQAINLGVSGYLMKPVDEDELKEAITKVIKELEKDSKLRNAESESGAEFAKTEGDNAYVSQVIESTKEHFAEKISIEGFSEQLGVSSSYLSRKFKEATGMTYLDFLNKYRVKEAIKLLETGQYKIYEVSDMTGFSDYKHFNTVFKRYTDRSPSEYIN